MTSDERRRIRQALIYQELQRISHTDDFDGTGEYQEVWQHRDGSKVTIDWTERDEVRFHSIKSAFEDDPEISEDTADAIALIAEVLSFAIVCVVLAFLIYGVLG